MATGYPEHVVDCALQARANGYSYSHIAAAIRSDLGHPVSEYTVRDWVTGRTRTRRTRERPPMNPNTIALAVQIADSAARSDIECYCAMTRIDGVMGQPGFRTWYDTGDVDEVCPREDITDALRYLELRGQLIRDPQQPAFVTFPSIASLQDAAA